MEQVMDEMADETENEMAEEAAPKPAVNTAHKIASWVEESPAFWWMDNRRDYNQSLISAAPVSFIILLLVWLVFGFRFPCLDVTFFVIFFSALFFIVLLPIADLFYAMGPRAEVRLGPSDPDAFRRRAFFSAKALFLFIIYLPVVVSLIWTATGHSITMC
jgi:hypothetical protein